MIKIFTYARRNPLVGEEHGESEKLQKVPLQSGLGEETEEEVAICARWGKHIPANSKRCVYSLCMPKCSDLVYRLNTTSPAPSLHSHLLSLTLSSVLAISWAAPVSLCCHWNISAIRCYHGICFVCAAPTTLRTPPSTWQMLNKNLLKEWTIMSKDLRK